MEDAKSKKINYQNFYRLTRELEDNKAAYAGRSWAYVLEELEKKLGFPIPANSLRKAAAVAGLKIPKQYSRTGGTDPQLAALESRVASLVEFNRALIKRVEVLERMMDKHESDLEGAMELVRECQSSKVS